MLNIGLMIKRRMNNQICVTSKAKGIFLVFLLPYFGSTAVLLVLMTKRKIFVIMKLDFFFI